MILGQFQKQIGRSMEQKIGWMGLIFLFSGCASTGSDRSLASFESEEEGEELPLAQMYFESVSPEAQETLREVDIDRDFEVESTLQAAVAPVADGDLNGIPVSMNDAVRKWIAYFTGKDRERFARFLERGHRYREVVQTVLRENGVPPELFYLAMIESGYSIHAHSRARAVGAWQFIAATGKRYGLDYNYYVDERRDIVRATEAAARYFRDLYMVYQDWYLALSAYNSGEMRVMGAIMRGKSRNFWELVRQRALPRETANYVPKFLAAMIIGTHMDQYGFSEVSADPYPEVAAVSVPTPIKLSDLAQQSGISKEVLSQLNPHLRRGMTPPQGTTYEVWVPKEEMEHFQDPALIAALESKRQKGVRGYYADASGTRYHRVRWGENLSTIARKYRVSVSYLKRVNNLKSDSLRAGQRLRLSGASYGASSKTYRVRRGDSLSRIASRFGLSVRELKSLNGLRANRIYVGQRLAVGYSE